AVPGVAVVAGDEQRMATTVVDRGLLHDPAVAVVRAVDSLDVHAVEHEAPDGAVLHRRTRQHDHATPGDVGMPRRAPGQTVVLVDERLRVSGPRRIVVVAVDAEAPDARVSAGRA